ncbi:hypothetical protein H4R18_004603, partial [Coemansia javaensis]
DRFRCALRFLAVCRRWRYLALPVFYDRASYWYDEGDFYNEGPESPYGGPASVTVWTNLDIIASAGCAKLVKNVDIDIQFLSNPARCFMRAVQLIRDASADWSGVRSLTVNLQPGSSYFENYHGQNVTDDEICQAAVDLAAMMPGVRRLWLNDGAWCSYLTTLYTWLKGIYAEQLYELNDPWNVALIEGMVLRQIRYLNVSYNDVSRDMLSCTCPDNLEVLRMIGLEESHWWPSFNSAGDSDAAVIEFPRLRYLALEYHHTHMHTELGDSPILSPRQQTLRFPGLERLRIECGSGISPLLEQAEFPNGVQSMDVIASAGALCHIANMALSVSQRLALTVTSATPGSGVVAHINRILARARGCSEVVLETTTSTLPLLPADLESTALTCLCIRAPTTVDSIVEFIHRLPRLATLDLGCVAVHATQLDILVPGPDEPLIAPLATALECVSVQFEYNARPEETVSLLKYLLLRIPTLVKLASYATPRQPIVDFVARYFGSYPHLAQVKILVNGM